MADRIYKVVEKGKEKPRLVQGASQGDVAFHLMVPDQFTIDVASAVEVAGLMGDGVKLEKVAK